MSRKKRYTPSGISTSGGKWESNVSYEYQWYRGKFDPLSGELIDSKRIDGATGKTYSPTDYEQDIGYAVEVTATNQEKK
jgi:hypothetical protein